MQFSQRFTLSATAIHLIEVNNYVSSPYPLSFSPLLRAVAGRHSASFNHQAATMSIKTTGYPNRIDTASTLVHAPSSITTIPQGDTAPVRPGANGLYLWRSILDTHGQGILQCASDQFLDQAITLRLGSINTRDLVSLLAKAGRLGYNDTDIVEGDALDGLAYEADGGPQLRLATHSASKMPDVERDQGRDSTASELSPPGAYRPKRQKKNQEGPRLRRTRAYLTRPGQTTLSKDSGNNAKQRWEGMRMQDKAPRSYMASGKPDLGSPTKVGTVLQAEAPCLGSSTSTEKPCYERGAQPVVKQSQGSKGTKGTMPQCTNFFVISDTERESSAEEE